MKLTQHQLRVTLKALEHAEVPSEDKSSLEIAKSKLTTLHRATIAREARRRKSPAKTTVDRTSTLRDDV